ncbi:hypothetical protein R3W88_014309 [Solanum pinnatisectum]|uniref:Uncharacterized protein n=1 Tax=Solanum pinnatisectum TaxID=50273 RepID=A0AAV9KRQ1_9SOLN|nr:hypothetical protein R3W88_014309 [Solanum pinnatisectum]
MVTSASAVAAAIRNASTSLVEFVQTIEKDDGKNRGLVLPSVDFQRLCLEQSELFRRIVHPDSVLSVEVDKENLVLTVEQYYSMQHALLFLFKKTSFHHEQQYVLVEKNDMMLSLDLEIL